MALFCHNCEKELWHFVIRDSKPYCSSKCANDADKSNNPLKERKARITE